MRIILSVIFVLIAALSNAQQKIDLYGNKTNCQKVNLSKVAKEVTYISLETTPESLLSEELQIYYGKDVIIVGDCRPALFFGLISLESF